MQGHKRSFHTFLNSSTSPMASTIHVPLVVDWAESLNLVHKRVKTTAKIKRAKRVTLLDTRFRHDDVLMIVEQHRWRPVAPLSPSRHGRKHFAGQLHEVLPAHHVERVLLKKEHWGAKHEFFTSSEEQKGHAITLLGESSSIFMERFSGKAVGEARLGTNTDLAMFTWQENWRVMVNTWTISRDTADEVLDNAVMQRPQARGIRREWCAQSCTRSTMI